MALTRRLRMDTVIIHLAGVDSVERSSRFRDKCRQFQSGLTVSCGHPHALRLDRAVASIRKPESSGRQPRIFLVVEGVSRSTGRTARP